MQFKILACSLLLMFTLGCSKKESYQKSSEENIKTSHETEKTVNPHGENSQCEGQHEDNSQCEEGQHGDNSQCKGQHGDNSQKKLSSPIPLTWTVPETWKAQPTSGMRIVNFSMDNTPNCEAYIAVLTLAKFNLDDNISRWANQVGKTLDKKELKKVVKNIKSIDAKNGLSLKIINLNAIIFSDTAESMVVAYGKHDKTDIFIKIKSIRKNLINEMKNFELLCSSLTIKNIEKKNDDK